MIIDTLDNAAAYESLGPQFAKAFDYLRSGRPKTDLVGRHELDGDNLFAVIEEYTSKPIGQGRFESHRKYADVQYVVAGCERMGYAPLKDMAPQQAYDPDTDLEFFTGNGVMLRVPEGAFTVFFPQDAHMPGIADGAPAPVRKVVLKIRVK